MKTISVKVLFLILFYSSSNSYAEIANWTFWGSKSEREVVFWKTDHVNTDVPKKIEQNQPKRKGKAGKGLKWLLFLFIFLIALFAALMVITITAALEYGDNYEEAGKLGRLTLLSFVLFIGSIIGLSVVGSKMHRKKFDKFTPLQAPEKELKSHHRKRGWLGFANVLLFILGLFAALFATFFIIQLIMSEAYPIVSAIFKALLGLGVATLSVIGIVRNSKKRLRLKYGELPQKKSDPSKNLKNNN